MPITIPTTQELIDQFRAYIEARLNQTTPASDRAYNNVLSVELGMAYTSLFKFASDAVLSNLVQTATGTALDALGAEYDVTRITATACVLSITLTGTNGTVIPAGTVFVGVPSAALYTSQAAGTIALGTVTLTITAQVAGTSGNLIPTDTLALQNQIAGATGIPTVLSVTTTGTEAETDDAYRIRVLDAQQAQASGSNTASYRLWAQQVAGVFRAYPYAGSPPGSGVTSEPPLRTVYVECDPSIQADGIPSSGLIDQVRDSITTDPDTGIDRQNLGLTDGTLYVEPITRTQIYVQITSLDVPSGQVAQCKAAISSALTAYLLTITPFITGLDPAWRRNDTITNPSLSKVVQSVLAVYGASAWSVDFGLTVGTFTETYTIGQGEKTKLGAIAYV